MALNLEAKKVIIKNTMEAANSAMSIVAADYRGLSVAEMTDLRQKARLAGVTTRVVRNTLARRALGETPYATLDADLVGPIVLLFSPEDPGSAARIVRDFIKANKKLEVKALAIQGERYDGSQLIAVASLPTYDQAVAQLLSVMQAPVTKFVRTTSEIYAQLVRTFAAVRDQKEAA